MRRVNISGPPFRYDAEDPEGFRSGMFRFGRDLGAQETGMSVYELPPGQAVCPYHYEYGEDEWVLALEGRPKVGVWTGDEAEDLMVERSSKVDYFHGESG